ncbi:MAG: TonB-dependent receptor [Candidatus Accumulibacter sp.]|nr:TonB-dependent receptor [Accumulibacter sp.]
MACGLLFSWMPEAFAEGTLLPEVMVSGKVSPLEDQRAAVTQKLVLDRQAIEATGGLTVGEVLSKLPGVDAGAPSSDGTVNLRSRGMARDSVQVLIDGERPASNSRHAMLIVSRMPSGELERVEIMKGASAEFGGAPVTVNLVTTRGQRRQNLGYKLAVDRRGGRAVSQASLTAEGYSGPWSWTLPLTLNDHQSPMERRARRQDFAGGVRTLWQDETEKGRYEFFEQYFAPKINWKDGAASFSVWPMLFHARGNRWLDLERFQYADPAGGDGPFRAFERDSHEKVHYLTKRLRLEGETAVAGGKFSGRVSLMDGRRDARTARDDSAGQAREAILRDENELNAAFRLDRGWGKHVTSVGLEYAALRRDEKQAYGGVFVDGGRYRARERQRTLWVQDEWMIGDAVTLTGGLRGESAVLETDGDSRSRGALSPTLAARWEIDERWLLRSSLGGVFKMPRLDEISDAPVRTTGVNSPLDPDRRGNAALKPERGVSFEAGVEHYWPNESAVAGVNFYYRRTRDFIERRAGLEGARWIERPFNEGEARHWGVEFDAKMKSDPFGPKGGSLRLHLTLPWARVDDRRLGVTRDARELPRYILSIGYDQALPALSSSAGFLLQRAGDTRTSVAGEQWAKTRGRSALDAYWVRRLDRATNLRFTLQNILGEDLSRNQRAWSGGREWRLGGDDARPRAVMVAIEGRW